MEKLPQISEAEYEIMKIVWAESPISTNSICEKIAPIHNWSNKTVHTLLSRLLSKHVISYEQRGRMYYYFPIVSKNKYLSQENHLFLSRYYDGEMPTLLSSLLSDTQLSNEDLKKMYQLIDSKLKGGDNPCCFRFIFYYVILSLVSYLE